MRLILIIVAGALMMYGCGSGPEKKLDVQLMKSDPPMGCQMVGDVQAEGDDMNEAKQNLRLKANEQGGNYVRLDALDISGGDAIAAGAAFNCRKPGLSGSPEEQK